MPMNSNIKSGLTGLHHTPHTDGLALAASWSCSSCESFWQRDGILVRKLSSIYFESLFVVGGAYFGATMNIERFTKP